MLFPGRAALQHHLGGCLSKSPKPPSEASLGSSRGSSEESVRFKSSQRFLCALKFGSNDRTPAVPVSAEASWAAATLAGTFWLPVSGHQDKLPGLQNVAPALQLQFPVIVINELFYIYNSE